MGIQGLGLEVKDLGVWGLDTKNVLRSCRLFSINGMSRDSCFLFGKNGKGNPNDYLGFKV